MKKVSSAWQISARRSNPTCSIWRLPSRLSSVPAAQPRRGEGMVFQKPSCARGLVRNQHASVGGKAPHIAPEEIQLGNVVCRMGTCSRYVDGIMARKLRIRSAHDGAVGQYTNGLSITIIPPGDGRPADHPRISAFLCGVRLVTWDGNNVLHSLMAAAANAGMQLVAAVPDGYKPLPEVVAWAQTRAQQTGAQIELVEDARSAVRGADMLYTDTWTSMGQEAEAAVRRQVFPPYQINAQLLALAKPGAGVMHCLPAHRGEEITDEVADGAQSWLFDQAENRMHAEKAVLVRILGDSG